MKKSVLTASSSVLVLAALSLAGCGAGKGSDGHSSSSPNPSVSVDAPPVAGQPDTATEPAKPSNGIATKLTLEQDGENKLIYRAAAENGQPAEGKVTITVGDFTMESDKTFWGVLPRVHVGTYTATMTYEAPNGTKQTTSIPYTLKKKEKGDMVLDQIWNVGKVGDKWESKFQIKGNPIITGVVRLYEHKDEQLNNPLVEAKVAEDGKVNIPMPIREESGMITYWVVYMGDQDNAQFRVPQVFGYGG